MQSGLSLHLIVKDEAETIGNLLEYMMGWVDEMVVVDTGSRDNTFSIVKHYTIKAYRYQMQMDFSQVRNFALGQATKPWILQVDADEHPTGELMKYIREWVSQPQSRYDGMSIMRHNLVGGEDIGARTYERHIRLFRKGFRFTGRIHEGVKLYPTRVALAPDSLLLLHHKTIERQERQNRLYRFWREQQVVEARECYCPTSAKR
jgi:glycosyltransferase involved in cell wall biosynthesis